MRAKRRARPSAAEFTSASNVALANAKSAFGVFKIERVFSLPKALRMKDAAQIKGKCKEFEVVSAWADVEQNRFYMISLGELLIVMPTIPQSIQTLFNDHKARLAAVSAAPGVVGLSLDLDQISATYLSKQIQILVRPKYSADCNAGTTPEEKISRLASSVSRLAKQVRPLVSSLA